MTRMIERTHMKRVTALACSAMLLLQLAACANPSEGEESQQAAGSKDVVAAVAKDDAIAAKLPAYIRQKGGFTASINPDVAPIKFVDNNGVITGLNPELLRAAAKVLGTEVTFQRGSFDAMVPGLESKRFDAIASVGDYVERQKRIDFIDYLQTGTAILASTKLEGSELSTEQLCGLSIGYARGTSQQGPLEAANRNCQAAGKPAIKVVPYQDGGAGVLSVKSGQADAYWGDGPAMRFNVKEHPDLYKIVLTEKSGVYGIGIHKDHPDFRDALREALLKLVADGVYDALLKQWAQDGYGVPDMNVNSKNKLKG